MTLITENHPRKLPPLPAYADHLDRVLAARPAKPSRLRWLALLAGLLALWLWPAYTLAVICLGGPTFLLAWFLWSARQFGREQDEDRNFNKH